jgi:hypothetical protein
VKKPLHAVATLAVTVASCKPRHQEAPTAPPPSEVSRAAAAPTSTKAATGGHQEVASRLRDAVVRGDVAEAHRRAGELARVRLPPGPSESTDAVLDLAAASAEVANATELADVCDGFAGVTHACAGCHASRPIRNRAPSTPRSEKHAEHEEHEGAALDRLWGALLTGATSEWQEAAHDLAGKSSLETKADARRLRTSAARAGTAGDVAARTAVFAEIVTTCAECHVRARGR